MFKVMDYLRFGESLHSSKNSSQHAQPRCTSSRCTSLRFTSLKCTSLRSTSLHSIASRRTSLRIASAACRSAVPLALSLAVLAPGAHAATVFINEFHYDNNGSDVAEGIELAGTAGQSVEGWQILLYNGADGGVYRSETLSGVFSDSDNGFGLLHFDVGALQNGPDGIALVDAASNVLEFLSYEGSFAASDGAANGLLSTDIGIAETPTTELGLSLQRIGSGDTAAAFSWQLQAASAGAINANQQFTAAVPVPAAAWLFGSALVGLARRRCTTLTTSVKTSTAKTASAKTNSAKTGRSQPIHNHPCSAT